MGKDGQKERALKRLKNIEDKNVGILRVVENKNATSNDAVFFTLEKIYNAIEEMDEIIDYRTFVFVDLGKHRYDYSNFLNLKYFFDKRFSGDILLGDAKREQKHLQEEI